MIGKARNEIREKPPPLCYTTEDVEAAKLLTKEQLAYILFKGGNTVSCGTTISSS